MYLTFGELFILTEKYPILTRIETSMNSWSLHLILPNLRDFNLLISGHFLIGSPIT